jgi:hypothetical protein
VVGVASWLLISLVIVLVTAAAPYGAHVANVSYNLDRATEETNRQPPLVVNVLHTGGNPLGVPTVINRRPTTLGLFRFYLHDVLVLVAILVLVALLIGTLRRLWRGSSGARNVVFILAGLVAFGTVVTRLLEGDPASASSALPGSFDATYARFVQASTPVWNGPVVRTATIALPLIALCAAILLLSPPATEYFRAMRRSGTY